MSISSIELAELLKDVCSKGLPFKFTATGMSMSPFICDGDTIVIEPYSENRPLQVGDIVAFTEPVTKKLIVHRIVQEQNNHFLLKGDNVFPNDGLFRKKSIHGYVKKVIILGKNFHIYYGFTRRVFLFLNNFKKIISFLSRHKILTLICRVQNKILSYVNPY